MQSSLPQEPQHNGVLIYNVTVKVDHAIHNDWLEWMKNEHIPDVMKTGCFVRYQLVRIMGVEENDGVTYATQYYASNKTGYELYIQQYEPVLRHNARAKWAGNFVEFGSLMQVVH